ncbi:hypothetical protein EDB85DRAFT_1901574 [Lactarius pseudohatsudake]|nr:hypothetical protein EDB85DRAFT_1901574 [Lactarius pseudohatsudake]
MTRSPAQAKSDRCAVAGTVSLCVQVFEVGILYIFELDPKTGNQLGKSRTIWREISLVDVARQLKCGISQFGQDLGACVRDYINQTTTRSPTEAKSLKQAGTIGECERISSLFGFAIYPPSFLPWACNVTGTSSDRNRYTDSHKSPNPLSLALTINQGH